ncbi:MAG: phosphatase PAP2-related protein [Patescibacteria group bacterium]|nr:phosphatase PAP2-related protein [Patescibacteria group bacterium]
MKHIIKKHAYHWAQKSFIESTILGFVFFALSIIINYFAGKYASSLADQPVTDLILNILPVIYIEPIFIQGFITFLIILLILIFIEPKRIPFILKSFSLFVLIRSFFIILTHIGPYPAVYDIQHGVLLNNFLFTGDLFFSGHTGLPFLMALIFWKNVVWRYIFLLLTVIFSITVLLGHIHYSIDVFGAIFITYAIYHLSIYLFKKDYTLFESAMEINNKKSN